MKNQKIILISIFVLLLAIIIFYIPSLNQNNIKINSFEECASAGFPVMESYPRQCRDSEGNLFVEDIEPARINCTDESRNVDSCIEIYQPVCGWSDPEKIRCIKYPCASNYGNSCAACRDATVAYYTSGECPE